MRTACLILATTWLIVGVQLNRGPTRHFALAAGAAASVSCTVGQISWPSMAATGDALSPRDCPRASMCSVLAHIPRDLRFTPTRYEFQCGGGRCDEIASDPEYVSPELKSHNTHGVRVSTFVCRLKKDWFVRYWRCCAIGDRSTDGYWLSDAMLAYRPFLVGLLQHENMPFIPSIAELKASGQWDEWKLNISHALAQQGGRPNRRHAPDITFRSRVRAVWLMLVTNAAVVLWFIIVLFGGALVTTAFVTHRLYQRLILRGRRPPLAGGTLDGLAAGRRKAALKWRRPVHSV